MANAFDKFGYESDEAPEEQGGNPFDKFGYEDNSEAEPEAPAPVEAEDPTWEDYGRSIMGGFAQLGQGAAWFARKMQDNSSAKPLEPEGLGNDFSLEAPSPREPSEPGKFERAASAASEYWAEGLSSHAKKALQTEILGSGQFGDKWDKLKLMAVGSLPGTMLGMGLGGKAAGVLANAGVKGRTAAAVGYGAGEASVAAPTQGAMTEEKVKAMSHEELMASPEYRAAYESYSELPESRRQSKAKMLVADAAAGDSAALTALTTFVLSAPLSTVVGKAAGVLPNAPGRVGGALAGAVEEALQETLQSGTQQMAENIGMQRAVPDTSIWKDVPEQAVAGGLSGAMMGGVVGAVTGPHSAELTPATPRSPIQDVEDAQHQARETARAEGADDLQAELAAAVAGAEASARYAEQHGDAAAMVAKATKDYVEGTAQMEEDKERKLLQDEAAANYEAEMQRRADMETAYNEQAAKRAKEEDLAYAQREQQLGEQVIEQEVAIEKANKGSSKATLADVITPDVKAALTTKSSGNLQKVEVSPTSAPIAAAKQPDEIRLVRPTAKNPKWVISVKGEPVFAYDNEREAKQKLVSARRALAKAKAAGTLEKTTATEPVPVAAPEHILPTAYGTQPSIDKLPGPAKTEGRPESRPVPTKFYRSTEANNETARTRASPDGEIGAAIYATENRQLAASYGGGPTAKEGSGRVVHELETNDLPKEQYGYVEAGSKIGELARLVDHNGNVLLEYEPTKKTGAEVRSRIRKIAKKAGIKVIVGMPGSVAENQIAVVDESVLTPSGKSKELNTKAETPIATSPEVTSEVSEPVSRAKAMSKDQFTSWVRGRYGKAEAKKLAESGQVDKWYSEAHPTDVQLADGAAAPVSKTLHLPGKKQSIPTGWESADPESQPKGLNKTEADKALGEFAGVVTVLDSWKDVPTDILDSVPAEVHERIKRARGFFHRASGTAYVIAERHTSIKDLQKTALHEVVGHKGLRSLLGNTWIDVMDDIYNNAINREFLTDYAAQHGMDANNEDQRRILADEYAAHLAEDTVDEDASLLRRIIDAVRAVLRKIGIVEGWTDADVKALLRQSRSALADVSEHAKRVPRGEDLLFADNNEPPRGQPANDHPLNIHYKFGATAETQAQYNPGFVRSRLAAIKDVGYRNIDKVLATIPRRNLPDFMAPGKMPSTAAYVRTAQHMDGRRNELMTSTDEIAKDWLRFHGKDHAAGKHLAELMHASTLAGVDPSKDYEPMYATTRSFKGKTIDVKLSNEQQALERQRLEQWKRLRNHWKNTSPEGQALYSRVRDSYSTLNEQVKAAIETRIGASIADAMAKENLLTELRKQFEAGEVRGPYFPLARFGKFWASAKTADNEVVSFIKSDSYAEIEAWEKSMQDAGFKTDSGEKMTDTQIMAQLDPKFVAKVTSMANDIDSELADEIWQMYLKTMPEMSMRTKFIHRKGRLGFTGDAIRAFGSAMFHGAHQLARLEHMHVMDGQLEAMGLEARQLEQMKDPEAKWAVPLWKEMKLRHEWARNPQSSAFSSMLTSAGFAWYLGATGAAGLVNLSQTAMVSAPMMAARYGWVNTTRELLKAAAQYAGSRGPLGNRLRDDERLAWDDAKRIGLFEKTNAHSLAGIADEGVDYSSVRTQAMHYISWFFHKAEELNRQVTFMATYRLARQANQSHQQAINTSEDLTWDSHFDYSNTNRARIMQGDTAKVLLLFRQYSANMTYRLVRDFNDSFRGASPALKKQARKQFIGMLGMTFTFAGASGMPLYWLFEMVANALMGDDDKPADVTSELRAYLTDSYGQTWADAIMKGPVDAATGATVSGRVGLNGLWIRQAPGELEGADLWAYYLGEMAGPLPNIGKDMFTAMALADKGFGDRAAERFTPKAVRDVFKAFRYAKDGVANTRGDVSLAPEELTRKDLFLQSIGFTPVTITRQADQARAIRTMSNELTARRTLLMDRLFLSARNEDPKGIKEAVNAIATFNRANPGIAIGSANIVASAKSRAAYSAQAVNGVAVQPGLSYLHEKFRFTDKPEASE